MKLTRRDFTAGVAATLATPAFIKSAGAQGATVKIGMVLPVTGSAAEQGKFALNGAKLALEAVNKAGGILGKQVELITEDDQTTNPALSSPSQSWRLSRTLLPSLDLSARRRFMRWRRTC
jgi:branched-chain amino acid transport system substrate-binding protein